MVGCDEQSREQVAARLKRIREVFNLEKKAFAERAGLTMQTYGPFENGRRDLSLQAAKSLCRTYDLSLDYLYFGKTGNLPVRVFNKL